MSAETRSRTAHRAGVAAAVALPVAGLTLLTLGLTGAAPAAAAGSAARAATSSAASASGSASPAATTKAASATPSTSPSAARATPTASKAPTAPTAPTIAYVTPGDTTATVHLTGPKSSGGSTVLGYIVTASSGGRTITGQATSSPVVVKGLTDGVTYSFTAKAYNAVGESPASAAVRATPVVGPVALTLTASAIFVHLGTKTTYSGTVTRGTAPVAGTPVTVSETYSDGKIVGLGKTVTAASGAYSFTTTPLYNGTIAVNALSAKATVASRVIVSLSTPKVSVSGGVVTVKVSSAPGFITSPSRQERAQLQEVSSSGKVLKVLATVDAAARSRAHGYPHGVNVITGHATLPSGSYRLVIKVLGTPVNTGATSKVARVSV